MPNQVSPAALAAMSAQETGEVALTLVTIEHPTFTQPIRVVDDKHELTSRGDAFVGFPFRIDLPSDTDEELPRVTLEIDNVDREAVKAMRSANSPPAVKVEVVLASTPDVVEVGPFDLTMRGAGYDALVVSAVLSLEDLLNEPFPARSFTPETAPGLF